MSRFAYDPVERLREVTQPEREIERFVYDSTGNLLRRGEREFRYEQPDRLTKADDVALVYDEIGNLIEKRRGGSVIRYSYDPDNQLVAVESKEGGRIEFAYDAFGRRIAKKTKDGETGFLWDGDVLLAEERGERSNEYIFEPGSFAPLCRFDGEGFEAYHNDHLGTPRELTDERGQVVWSASYDVYGSLNQLHKAESESQIRFQGQYEDAETGLHYNFYRYFDPAIGKYISQDPMRLLGGPNQYRYTLNPVNWIDPLGLAPCPQLYARYKILRAKGLTPQEALFVARTGRYTPATRAHLSSSHHHSVSSPIPGKGRFFPTAGGQKFADEVIYHPNTVVTRQWNGRLRFDNPDLGRNVGYGTDNITPVRGGRVVLESPTPWSGSPHSPGDIVTQFPQ